MALNRVHVAPKRRHYSLSITFLLMALLITFFFSMSFSVCLSSGVPQAVITDDALETTSYDPSVPPAMEWDANYLETGYSSVSHVVQTNDSGYLMAGVTGYKYAPRVVWLLKVDSSGKMQWNKSFNFLSNAAGLAQTWDGGYVIAGDSQTPVENSFWGVSDSQGIMLLKIDQNGYIQWNKTLTSTLEGSSYMTQTKDAGYIILGNIPPGSVRIPFLIKTDAWGNVQWKETYGGDNFWNSFSSVIQTSEGGYAVAGTNFNGTGDIYLHFWLVKVDSEGNVLWSKTYGSGLLETNATTKDFYGHYSRGDDEANCIVQTPDDGFVLAGNTYVSSLGDSDVWLVKTDSSGNMVWNRTYGGSGIFTVNTVIGPFVLGSNGNGIDKVNSLIQTNDDGFAFAGVTPQSVRDYSSGAFAWLVKLDSTGNVQWNQTYPKRTAGDWIINSLIETSDGGFALGGAWEHMPSSYYYLVKTQQALPPPAPTPPPMPPSQTELLSEPNLIWLALFASTIILIAFLALVFSRRRRRQFSTSSSLS